MDLNTSISNSHNQSTNQERKEKLNYLRNLYTLFFVELLVALVWSSFCVGYYNPLGAWIVHWWEFALVTGIITVVLMLLALFVLALRNPPINMAIYAIFIFVFAYTMGYLCALDKSLLVYYTLWLLTAVAAGFMTYSYASNEYMGSTSSLLVILGSCSLVFMGFLIFTELSLISMIFILLLIVVFGYYLNYDVRKMVRSGFITENLEDPFIGAVKIFLEGFVVFFRFIELLGRMFVKTK